MINSGFNKIRMQNVMLLLMKKLPEKRDTLNNLLKSLIYGDRDILKYFSKYKICYYSPFKRINKQIQIKELYEEFLALKNQLFRFENLHPSFIQKIIPKDFENFSLIFLLLTYEFKKGNSDYKIYFNEIEITISLTFMQTSNLEQTALFLGKLIIIYFHNDLVQTNIVSRCIENQFINILDSLKNNNNPEYLIFLNYLSYSFYILNRRFIDSLVYNLRVFLEYSCFDLKEVLILLMEFYSNNTLHLNTFVKKFLVIYESTTVPSKLMIVQTIMHSFYLKIKNSKEHCFIIFNFLIKLIKIAFVKDLEIIIRYFLEELSTISNLISKMSEMKSLFIEELFTEVYTSCKKRNSLEKLSRLKILRVMIKLDVKDFKRSLVAYNLNKNK